MKVLIENWRKFIQEDADSGKEKLEEGPISALALALGLGGAPAAADTGPEKEPTHQVDSQQAEAEYDSTDITVGYINAYVKHLESKAGSDINKKSDINFTWMPIQKAVYDMGPAKALKTKGLDDKQKELLKLVMKQIEKSDIEMQNYYGKIGSKITMKESLRLQEHNVSV
tara:strand:- start:171 stop:680 length:510 start_codon:yes stop_codon:yes gene_type:complete